MSLSKQLLNQFSSQSKSLQQLKTDLEQYHEGLQDIDLRNYKPEVKENFVNTMKESIQERYLMNRQADINTLSEQAEQLKVKYEKQYCKPDMLRDRVNNAKLRFGALSDKEIEIVAMNYKTDKADLVHADEIDVLSAELKSRNSPHFDGVRDKAIRSNYTEPYRRLNPQLFNEREVLQSAKDDEIVVFATSQANPSANGATVKGTFSELFEG